MRVSNENIVLNGFECNADTHAMSFSENEHIRDPFIMLVNGKYYVYHSLKKDGIGVWVSDDLKTHSGSITVFKPGEDFFGIDHFFWAPECHYYNGSFYIFTSVMHKKDGKHHIAAYKADNPLGPFAEISGGSLTPWNMETIDGTLYVDEEGSPWLVFVNEWISMPDKNGSMCAARLSEDFTHLVSEPITLFYARDLKNSTAGVTDGPYICAMSDGTLKMIWSNFIGAEYTDYAVAVAGAKSIDGEWKQEKILYSQKNHAYDGGHGMLFKDKEGRMLLSFHGNNSPKPGETEHLELFEVTEENNTLCLGNKIL